MTTYLKFKELHNQAHPLLIGNVWNVQSARVMEKLNFRAIATSSAAIAHSLGYEDGEQLPFSELLFITNRIRQSVSLPLSVDMEFGYGNTPAEITANILALYNTGVAGINIEDSFIEDGERTLKDSSQFSRLLQEVIKCLLQQKVSIFINVRCDAFLLNVPGALAVALERIKKYEQAGANGIFLPCICKESDIAPVIAKTALPLNVMCVPGLPNFKTLEELGVKRISMGNYLNKYACTALENMTAAILTNQCFNPLF